MRFIVHEMPLANASMCGDDVAEEGGSVVVEDDAAR